MISTLLNINQYDLVIVGSATNGKLLCSGPLILEPKCKPCRLVGLYWGHNAESNNVKFSTHLEIFDFEYLENFQNLIAEARNKSREIEEMKSSLCDGEYFDGYEFNIIHSGKNSDAERRNAEAFQKMLRSFCHRLNESSMHRTVSELEILKK